MNIKESFSLTIEQDDMASHVTMKGTVPKDVVQEMQASILEDLQKKEKIDGFRDGTAPLDVVKKTVGVLEVWRQSAHKAVMKHFPDMLGDLEPLGRPNLTFTSIPAEGDVDFQVSFFVLPKVNLPDYVAIVRSIEGPEEPEEVTEEEVQEVVNDVRRGMYKEINPEKPVPTDEHELPQITDDYVKKVSQQYSSVDEFVKGVRVSMKEWKQSLSKNKFRERMVAAILEKTPVTIPDNVVEEDATNMYEDLKERLGRTNTPVEKFLENEGITKKELQDRLRKESRQRAHEQLVIDAIAEKEDIAVDPEIVEKEVERLKRQNSDATEEQIEIYAITLFTNEAVVRSLEEHALSLKSDAGDTDRVNEEGS